MKRLSKILFSLVLLQSASAYAGEIYEFYNGVRSLGMGGAYVTTANDETAMYTNPAGLGKLRDVFITIADPEMGLTDNITDFVPFGDITDLASAQGLVAIMADQPGEHLHFHAQLSPSLVLPNFGIGLLAKWETNFSTDDPATTITMNYRNDYALTMAYNFRLFDGILKVGVNAKYIDRIEVRDQQVPTSTTNLEFKNISSEGTGVSSDAGIILTAPWQLLPSIGVVVRDVGHTSFTMSDGAFYRTSTRPQQEQQQVDAGISISPIFGKNVRGVFTAEVHDVTTKDPLEKEDIMRRFHGGMELNVADFFFLRGGWNQKFWTGGFEFASEKFQLQGAYYGEDVGTPNNPIEDRRLVGKFVIRF
jgi:hypothetical protein